jgi:phosphatidylglycerophosphate synthase
MVTRQVASYAEFRKKALKKEEILYVKYLIRPLSTRLSWLLLKKYPKVNPNQVTMSAFCIGLIGSSLVFFARSSVEVVIASLILYFWNVFDCVDGEIARFKDMKTPTGFFLEITFDYLIIAILPFGVSFYLYKSFIQTNVLFLGFADCVLLLFYALANANYSWTLFKFTSQPSSARVIEPKLTESQVMKRFGGKLSLVNRHTIQIWQIIFRIGNFLIQSSYMVLMLIILALIDVLFKPEITLWNQKVTTLHIFLLLYLLLIPVCISMFISEYVSLKTRLE